MNCVMEVKQDLTLYGRLLQPNLQSYCQLIKNAMFTINDYTVAKSAMLDQCREYFSTYKTHLTCINKFATGYQSGQAVCWYTKDCFMHRIVNKVLRAGNIEYCSLLRFCIADLSEQIYQLKCQQQKNIIETERTTVLYRGLRQSEEHLEIIRNFIGHVILIKGFISTSRNKQVALLYAGASHPQSSKSQSLLIELYVDMKASDIIAADISHLSNFPEECEVLFDIGTQFRVESLTYDSLNSIWGCRLIAISNKSEPIQLSQHISSNESCINIDKYTKEEIKLERLTRQERRHKFNARVNNEKNDLLRCRSRSVSWIADSLSDQGRILQQKALLHWQRNGDLYQSRSECQKAWELFKQGLDNNSIGDKDTACFLNNFGYTCQKLGDTEYAIDLLKQSVEIRTRYEASEYFLAQSLRNLGLAYMDQGDYEKALTSLNHALMIGKPARSTAQWSTSMTLRNLGYFHYIRGNHTQAAECFSKAIDTFQQCADLWTDITK